MADIPEYNTSQIWLMWCKNGRCYEFQQWSFWLMWLGKVLQTLELILTPNNIHDNTRRVLKRLPQVVEILEVLSVMELVRAQLLCNIVGHILHAVWLILLLVVSDLGTFVRPFYITSSISGRKVSVNTLCTLVIVTLDVPYKQSGTKPNLVAKILATRFGVLFVIYIMFSKICSIRV